MIKKLFLTLVLSSAAFFSQALEATEGGPLARVYWNININTGCYPCYYNPYNPYCPYPPPYAYPYAYPPPYWCW